MKHFLPSIRTAKICHLLIENIFTPIIKRFTSNICHCSRYVFQLGPAKKGKNQKRSKLPIRLSFTIAQYVCNWSLLKANLIDEDNHDPDNKCMKSSPSGPSLLFEFHSLPWIVDTFDLVLQCWHQHIVCQAGKPVYIHFHHHQQRWVKFLYNLRLKELIPVSRTWLRMWDG